MRKIFAIIFSFGLWFFVVIDSNYRNTQEIEVLYQNLAESLIIIDSVSTVRATFSGSGRDLIGLWISPPKIVCNLNEVQLGSNKFFTKDLTLSNELTSAVVSYEDKSINVTVDKKIKKDLKIDIPVKGAVKEGYALSSISVLDTIQATGPKRVLQQLKGVVTESLDIKNRFTSFKQELKIPASLPQIQLSRDIIRVEVEIDTNFERIFTNIPLKIIYLPRQRAYSTKRSLDTLVIAGPKKKIEMVAKEDIEIRIRVVDLASGEYYLPAEIILPEYLKPIYSSPKRFPIIVY